MARKRTCQNQLIDLGNLISRIREEWTNVVLTHVNDAVVRLGVIQGQYHWHKHDQEDEFFFVLEGNLVVETRDGTNRLGPWQGYTVARGVEHRTLAPERTVLLMVEPAAVKPEGD